MERQDFIRLLSPEGQALLAKVGPLEAKADVVTRETFGSALFMGEQALRLLGSSDNRARRVTEKFREHDEAGLLKRYQVWGDDHAYGLLVSEQLSELEKVLQDDIEDESETAEPATARSSG